MVRLSLVNMYLHGFASPSVAEYDSLTSEEYWGRQFDVILANPPFMTPKGGVKPHKRFSITSKRTELLFVDFISDHLSSNGKAGVIVPEGIMFVAQGAFTEVRRKLVLENKLLAVITLPHGVFKPYASVKTHILILDRRLARISKNVLFIEVTADGYTQSDTRQAIAENDIPEASRALQQFRRSLENNDAFDNTQFECISCVVAKEKILAEKSVHLIGRWYRLEETFKKLTALKIPTLRLGDCCYIARGLSPNMATLPGEYPLVVPAPDRKTSDGYSFENEAVCVPLVSSSGHGKADIKRLHYQEGRFALADTMCSITMRDKSMLRPRYVFEILSTHKDDWLVPLMTGATNVTLDPNDLKNVVIPVPSIECQDSIIEGIALAQMIQQLEGIKKQMLGQTTSTEASSLEEVIRSLQKKRSNCITIDSVWTA